MPQPDIRPDDAALALEVLPPAEVERLLREWGSVLFRRAERRGDIPRDAGRRVNSAAQAVKGMRTTQEVVG